MIRLKPHRFLLPLLLTLFCFACPQPGSEIFQSSAAQDIYNRFTTQEVVPAAALPPRATRIKFFPGGREFLVLGQSGEVFHFVLAGDTARFLGSFQLPEVAPGPVEIGLTDVAFDPQFAANGFLYFCFTTGDNHWNRIVRLLWSNNYAAMVNSLVLILQVDRIAPAHPHHGIYALAFGADGYLYATLGDATQAPFAQEAGSLLGKLLRLAPRATGGYDIPADNPFVGDGQTRGEIAAFGLRSPFRMLAWHDKILIGDVGLNHFEEINFYTKGRVNFGWPECEGNCERSEFRNPILAIGHSDPAYQVQDPEPVGDLRHALALGVVYEVSGDKPYGNLLDGRLIFNDVFLGYVRAVEISPTGALGDNQHIFHKFAVTSMDIGADNIIYGTTIYDSEVFRVVLKAPAATMQSGTTAP